MATGATVARTQIARLKWLLNIGWFLAILSTISYPIFAAVAVAIGVVSITLSWRKTLHRKDTGILRVGSMALVLFALLLLGAYYEIFG